MRILADRQRAWIELRLTVRELGEPLSGTVEYATTLADHIEAQAYDTDAGFDEQRAWAAFRHVVEGSEPPSFMLSGVLMLWRDFWLWGETMYRVWMRNAKEVHREQGERENATRAEWAVFEARLAEQRRARGAQREQVAEVEHVPAPMRGGR